MFWVFVSIVVILWYISENGGVYGIIYGKDYKDYPGIVGKKFKPEEDDNLNKSKNEEEDKEYKTPEGVKNNTYTNQTEDTKASQTSEFKKEDVKEDRSVELGEYEGTFDVDYTEEVGVKEGKETDEKRVRQPRKLM